MYNAAFFLELTGPGPARAFLKVSPPEAVPVLTYEHELMRAEAAVLQQLAAADLPGIPALMAADFTGRVIPNDWLFMDWLPGQLLTEARAGMAEADRVKIRRQIGRIAGAANRITSSVFGYPAQPKLQAASWSESFGLMIVRLLEDAVRFDAALPRPVEAIAHAFDAALSALAPQAMPQLVHYDLWDGNILVRPVADGWEVTGLIDWERAFYGDPLAEVVSLSFVGSPAERAAVLEGLVEGRGEPAKMSDNADRRLALYRAYLWLIMIVEAGPRGFGGSIRLPTSGAGQRLLRDLAIATG